MRSSIGFIGGGNMAEAIIKALITSGTSAGSITVSDPAAERLELMAGLGAHTSTDNSTPADCQTVVLAVKPQVMETVLTDIQPEIRPDALFISIAAGIPCSLIEHHLGNVRVIRVMPNTPMLAGSGVAALCKGTNATDPDLDTAEDIFSAAAAVVRVKESQMDAVTAVSGSGPAYFFFLAEKMAEAGQAEGLDRQTAERLAAATLTGAGALIRDTGESAAELRKKVTSPGGTTEAALRKMEELNIGNGIIQAVAQAAQRSRELAP